MVHSLVRLFFRLVYPDLPYSVAIASVDGFSDAAGNNLRQFYHLSVGKIISVLLVPAGYPGPKKFFVPDCQERSYDQAAFAVSIDHHLVKIFSDFIIFFLPVGFFLYIFLPIACWNGRF